MWNQLSTFDAESNLLKSKIPISGERGVGGTNFQLLMLSSNLLRSKIPISGGGGVGGTNFQLLMLSPNFSKKKILQKIFLVFRQKLERFCFGL